VFNAQTTGILRFKITPNDPVDDYDWDLFDLTNGKCSDLKIRPRDFLVSANCWGSPIMNGETGIDSRMSGGTAGNCNGPGTQNGPEWNDDVTVIQGHTYLLYITYMPNSTAGFKIDFSASEASLFNSMPTKLAFLNKTFVEPGDTTITFDFNQRISCSTVSASNFSLKNNGKTIEIKSVSSKECLAGSDYSKSFEVLAKTSFLPVSGQIQLISDVKDACGNATEKNALKFSIDSLIIHNIVKPLNCTNAASGGIKVSVDNPVDSLQYSIDNGNTYQTSPIFENLIRAKYQIVVKNKFNFIQRGALVEVADPPKFSMTVSNISSVKPCYGDASGSFQVNYSGTNFLCQISWDGGQTYRDCPQNATFGNFKGGTYEVFLKDQTGCQSKTSTVIVPQPDMVAFSAASVSMKCHGDKNGSINFSNISSYSQLQYSIDGGKNFSTTSLYTNLQPGKYNVQAKAPSGCLSTIDSLILSDPPPIQIQSFNQTNIRFDNVAAGGSVNVNATGGWGTLVYSVNGSSSTSGFLSGIPEGSYNVTITDSLGCSIQTPTHIMRSRLKIITVNTFSPNGDGKNDTWVIKYTEDYPEMMVKIFDRWNKQVYQSEIGYPNPWDGTENGKPLPMDTYYYLIELGDGFEAIRGYITLMR
jgi:gliding motility-associated-like protein